MRSLLMLCYKILMSKFILQSLSDYIYLHTLKMLKIQEIQEIYLFFYKFQ